MHELGNGTTVDCDQQPVAPPSTDGQAHPTFPLSKFLTLKNTQRGARYNIRNEVVIGALLLPGGLGSERESTLRPFHLLGCTCG